LLLSASTVAAFAFLFFSASWIAAFLSSGVNSFYSVYFFASSAANLAASAALAFAFSFFFLFLALASPTGSAFFSSSLGAAG
jgi:hypothetical protein